MSIKDLFKENIEKFKNASNSISKQIKSIKNQLDKIAFEQSELHLQRAELLAETINTGDVYSRFEKMVNLIGNSFFEKNKHYLIGKIACHDEPTETELFEIYQRLTNSGALDNGFIFWAMKKPILEGFKNSSADFSDPKGRTIADRMIALNSLDDKIAASEKEEELMVKTLNETDAFSVEVEYKNV